MIISDSNSTNAHDETLVSEVVNDTAVQAEINVSGAGVTAYANINNTAGGNLAGRKLVRIYNAGRSINWRVSGQLSGSVGEYIAEGEAVDIRVGENILIELVEDNPINQIHVIITEAK